MVLDHYIPIIITKLYHNILNDIESLNINHYHNLYYDILNGIELLNINDYYNLYHNILNGIRTLNTNYYCNLYYDIINGIGSLNTNNYCNLYKYIKWYWIIISKKYILIILYIAMYSNVVAVTVSKIIF